MLPCGGCGVRGTGSALAPSLFAVTLGRLGSHGRGPCAAWTVTPPLLHPHCPFVLLQELQEGLRCSGRFFPAVHSPAFLILGRPSSAQLPGGDTGDSFRESFHHWVRPSAPSLAPGRGRSCRQPQQRFYTEPKPLPVLSMLFLGSGPQPGTGHTVCHLPLQHHCLHFLHSFLCSFPSPHMLPSWLLSSEALKGLAVAVEEAGLAGGSGLLSGCLKELSPWPHVPVSWPGAVLTLGPKRGDHT